MRCARLLHRAGAPDEQISNPWRHLQCRAPSTRALTALTAHPKAGPASAARVPAGLPAAVQCGSRLFCQFRRPDGSSCRRPAAPSPARTNDSCIAPTVWCSRSTGAAPSWAAPPRATRTAQAARCTRRFQRRDRRNCRVAARMMPVVMKVRSACVHVRADGHGMRYEARCRGACSGTCVRATYSRRCRGREKQTSARMHRGAHAGRASRSSRPNRSQRA